MAETGIETSEKQAAHAPVNPFLVVGIGASAGGIAAIKDFFRSVQPDEGIAYVVVVHLSPTHESSLAEVLQSSTTMPIRQVTQRVKIEPDHVFVVPPNRKLALVDGHIDVADHVDADDRRTPIDMFFRTLADIQGERAACVVLSGTGADGAAGLKRVKEAGGLCVAQRPADAEFADMPRNAIATGLVDYVGTAVELGPRIASYARRSQAAAPMLHESQSGEQALADIFTQLRVRTGHDFSSYKRSTIMRRVERRMNVRELDSVRQYAKYFRENREETQALLKDLLISVTSFFRDPEPFAALGTRILPQIFATKQAADNIRVWVPGCATGEEVYSIAMLLAEFADTVPHGPVVQLFATDIDEAALAKARAGLYTANDTADISAERLRRFFVKEGEGYRVRRELREMVLFAAHNVIKDPPFSHLDVVSCRNLLIYLDRTAQERAIKLFHFALKPGGYLFLGTSESAEDVENLFVAVDKESHIFQGRAVNSHMPISPAPAPSTLPAPRSAARDASVRARLSYQDLHQRLLERYAPPSVIINEDFEILHLSEGAGRFLQFVGGEPTQNLLKVVRPELRLELHSALYQAVQQREACHALAGPLAGDGGERLVRMTVDPVFDETDTARGMILVLFQEGEASPSMSVASVGDGAQEIEPFARQLDEELVRVKLQLRTTVEQYELQQEEFKASNEELQAMNEELRSSSEELETSKEELQSVNEELTTVNQELKMKIDELSHANNDTRNLMNSTDFATVFIDRNLRIKLFTPRARKLFNLLPGDSGRPLMDVTHHLEYPEMHDDIEAVLDTLTVAEREVASAEQRWFIARVLPYRTADDRIAGVVLTFTDITERKRAEEALRESEERLRLVVESVRDYAIITLDLNGRIQTWNLGASDIFGFIESEAVGQSGDIIFSPEDRAAGAAQHEMQVARDTGRCIDERWHVRKDGARVYVSGVMAKLSRSGRQVGYTKIARDTTQRQQHEMAERMRLEQERVRLLQQLVTAQEEERRRISRDLHDQLGQEVTAIGLKLAVLKSAPELSPATRAELGNVQGIAQQLENDVEFLVWQLRPTNLDDLGLAEALADYAQSWSRYFNIPVRVQGHLHTRLPSEFETVLYRVAQEALNNVAKHAHARNVTIVLEHDGNNVVLLVEDDGAGFNMGIAHHAKSLGLVSMRERAALVGGSATVESSPANGTRVRAWVPAGRHA